MGAEPSETPRGLSASGWMAVVFAYLLVPLVLVLVGRDPVWVEAWVLSVIVLVAALDHRWGWTPELPVALRVLGLAVCVAGHGLAVWALVENPFFASMVNIQTERGHQVCDRGPYRLVRHPGYAGVLLTAAGAPLALGSAWASVATGVAVGVGLVRTALEDRTLMEELPGYREYARRVPARLLPGVW